ncbi:MAG: hypothetical protein EHM23_23760 [Acidobacteria bacterium]|nr:MAG: hypothetical protein EHM23_23760 [Acidobacteriota bacterium]
MFLIFFVLALFPESAVWEKDFHSWSLEEALSILNDSPWAREQTATRVVGGIGSGIAGEKEIYERFYVRLLSARPIREAYARADRLISNTESVDPTAAKSAKDSLDLDTSDWIVVAVAFRSNDMSREQEVKRELQTQTTETMKTRAYLSTARFPQVRIMAFFPALEDGVGAKFVFPRKINGEAVVTAGDQNLIFELEMPGDMPDVRTTFKVREMMVKGELIL